ncbi:hypothetical protein Syun_025511 [Stephania yunnanensis]|uniref:Uncharacterized protein n=1 Tax=Stephania yunnanensis TaxID=152371 RepID=A0AAP0ERT3_9MAGN
MQCSHSKLVQHLFPTYTHNLDPYLGGLLRCFHKSSLRDSVTGVRLEKRVKTGTEERNAEYKEEVANRTFPGPAHSPYRISGTDLDAFLNGLRS